MAHQGEGITGLKFAACDALGEVLAEAPGTRDYRRGGEVVEVVQDGADFPRAPLPRLELPGDAGEVFQLAEGVEPRKSRHEHDVQTAMRKHERTSTKIVCPAATQFNR